MCDQPLHVHSGTYDHHNGSTASLLPLHVEEKLVNLLAPPLHPPPPFPAVKKTAGAAGPAVDVWRKEKEVSRRKILSLLLVFYICWSVNVVDGLLLIVAHSLYQGPNKPLPAFYIHIYDSKYIYAIWLLEVLYSAYTMSYNKQGLSRVCVCVLQAILNPLQGLLNALAYGQVLRGAWQWVRSRCCRREEVPCVSR